MIVCIHICIYIYIYRVKISSGSGMRDPRFEMLHIHSCHIHNNDIDNDNNNTDNNTDNNIYNHCAYSLQSALHSCHILPFQPIL